MGQVYMLDGLFMGTDHSLAGIVIFLFRAKENNRAT